MSAVQPVAVYALRIPPGDVMIPAVPEFAAMFRVTMAAIDPTEEPQLEDVDDKRPPRATLKLVRVSDDLMDDDEDSDDDYDDELDDEDEDDESDEENGGPSTKKSRKQQLLEALAADAEDDEDEDMDDDDEIDAAAEIKKIIKDAKGKGKAIDGDSDEDDEDEDSEEGIELDECVICTLDPEKHYQQPLDIVVNEGEKIFFKVSGTHSVHLTGNYVMPLDDGQASLYDEDDEEDEYDLSPDEDELEALEALVDGDEGSDDLDDLADPRFTEVDSEEEAAAPKKSKGKNKRPAEESDDEAADLDALMAKSIKKEEAVNGDQKLSKVDKKKAKKLKKNDGEAATVEVTTVKKETAPNGDKKVQFAKDIIQGPTPSATPPTKKDEKKSDKKAGDDKKSGSLGVRDVQGVTVDDRKIGSGPVAKKGSKLEMRYIGKLENGKIFDSNKKGKPFSLKVGVGEVIKGWDIGLQGISAGGERRLIIPAHLAYGSKALPGIPKNSKLIFDVRCLSVQ